MKIDPKLIEILKKKETQEMLVKVGTEVLPEAIKGVPAFARGGASKVKDTFALSKDRINKGYESLNHEKIFYKKIKEKVIPFPSNYNRNHLKQFVSQSSTYIKQRSLTEDSTKKKFVKYNNLHRLLEVTIQNKDYEEYLKIYIGNLESNYFVDSKKLRDDFHSIVHDYRKVVFFLFNVLDGKKSEEEIMRELAKEKPITNI
ncbi:hypothetical protein [Psychrobacillus lasiicapitis]|uniref:Uncharacterized protein n=1 Tax=Psychrobacillus lasiicapitis TaxID=1636719 RepID=A0A544T383_9BACI|nr:hypothetical protein [Psychrobacillus lasiicapitis]TQR11920.1 hypothetical protein FG382_15010 [Psychrobacillus lasiicapitis]GGA20438.1 hypothetical protein GCM10011384_07350 [Psychrobacillus lasiicapitis]